MRPWGITVVVGAAAFFVASCASAGSTTPPTSNAVVATTTAPSPTPVTPGLEIGPKLTAACPVLTADEVRQILGGGQSSTALTATDRTVDDKAADKIFSCDCGAGGKNPFVLSLGNLTEKGFSAADAVKAFVDQAKASPQPIPNLGDAAAYFRRPSGESELAMAKRSHGELRTATFTALGTVPAAKLTELMNLVADRL